MADNVGSMNVEYSVSVNQAINNLNKINSAISKNESIFQKSAKKEQMATKKSGIVQKVFGEKTIGSLTKIGKSFSAIGIAIGVVTGSIYGLIKASSYGSIYTSQFGAILQQVADTIMEKTGLNTAIEELMVKFQTWADLLEDNPLAAFLELVFALGIALANIAVPGIGKIINKIIEFLSKSQTFQDLVDAVVRFKNTLADEGLWAAIKELIWNFIFWIHGKFLWVIEAILNKVKEFIIWLETQEWYQIAKITFGKIVDWIKTNIINVAYSWGRIILIKFESGINSIIKFVAAIIPDKIENAIKTLIEKAWQFGVDIANKIKAGLQSIPIIVKIQTIIDKVSGIFGGSGTSDSNNKGWIPESGDPFDYPGGSFANGGPVQKTGLALVHQGEYVIPKGGSKIDSNSGGDTYNISPIINITNSGSNNDMARQISKEIASEIKRIVKV